MPKVTEQESSGGWLTPGSSGLQGAPGFPASSSHSARLLDRASCVYASDLPKSLCLFFFSLRVSVSVLSQGWFLGSQGEKMLQGYSVKGPEG